MRRRFLCLLLILWAAALLGPAGGAGAASLVVDATSGEVLASDDPVAPWYPASLTKMMTVYLAFEALDLGALELADEIKVSRHSAAQPPTRIGLEEGDVITIEEAIEATIVRSANDAAVALAEAMAGSESLFAELMTFKAQELGMTGTLFRNASGLPNSEQVTTARDMVLLARALIEDFPLYYDFFSAHSITFRGRTLPTYNGLLVAYEGADGLKTGFTCASGYNVVISAERDGRRLIGVVLGSKNRDARSVQMRALLDAGFKLKPDAVDGTDVEALAVEEAEEVAARPPRVLGPDECGRTPEALVVQGPPGKAKTGPAGSGWAAALGAFPDQKDAQARLSAARSRLGGQVNGARATLVKRKAGKMTRYTALLTNLTQAEAAKACRFLQSHKTYCIALGPEALKNPHSRWW